MKSLRYVRYAICLLALAAVSASCGYRLVGTGGQFPAGVEQVAVHIFENRTKDTFHNILSHLIAGPTIVDFI